MTLIPPVSRPSRAQRLVTVGRWLCGRSLQQALQCTEQAIYEAEHAQEAATLGQALNLMGTIEMDLGLLSAAQVSFRRAREVALPTGDLEVQLKVANNLALLHLTFGDMQRAAQQFHLAQALFSDPRCQVPPGVAGMIRVNLAAIYNRWGDAERVLHTLETLDPSELELPEVQVYAELARAAAHLELGRRAFKLHRQNDAALHLQAMQDALQRSEHAVDPYSTFIVKAERANLEAQRLTLLDQPEQAEQLLRNAIQDVQDDFTEGVIQLRLTLARVLKANQPAHSIQEYLSALHLMDQGDTHANRNELLEELATLYEQQGDLHATLKIMHQLVLQLKNQHAPARAGLDLLTEQSGVTALPDERWLERLRIAEQQARTDALTGLYNRRALDETLPGLIQRLSLPGHTLHVLMVDIDHFKQVNDQFSHNVGDQVLRRIAAFMTSMAGPEALAARYGGEELLLALLNTTQAEALHTAEKLRLRVQSATWREHDLHITISIGVTSGLPEDTITSLVSRADEALYQAKHSGRNKTVYLPPEHQS